MRTGGVGAFAVVTIVVSALLGIYSVAAGLGGYLEDHLNILLRLILVVINRDPTPADSRADYLFHGNIAEILGD